MPAGIWMPVVNRVVAVRLLSKNDELDELGVSARGRMQVLRYPPHVSRTRVLEGL
jgi:hypothetical protein